MTAILARLLAFLASPFVRALERAILTAARPIVAAEVARLRAAAIEHLDALGDQLAHRATVGTNPPAPAPGQPDGKSAEIGGPRLPPMVVCEGRIPPLKPRVVVDAGPYIEPSQADREWWAERTRA